LFHPVIKYTIEIQKVITTPHIDRYYKMSALQQESTPTIEAQPTSHYAAPEHGALDPSTAPACPLEQICFPKKQASLGLVFEFEDDPSEEQQAMQTADL